MAATHVPTSSLKGDGRDAGHAHDPYVDDEEARMSDPVRNGRASLVRP